MKRHPIAPLTQILQAVLWLWTGCELMLDFLGRATVLGDMSSGSTVSGRAVMWLFSTPWWVPGLIATIVAGVWLMFVVQDQKPYSRPETITNSQSCPTTLSKIDAAPIPTFLRLEFKGGESTPTQIRADNIRFWYVLWGPKLELEFPGQGLRIMPRSWAIFILFDAPITLGQLVVQPANSLFPSHEVKVVTSNLALITTFGNDPPAGFLDVFSTLPS